MIRVLVAEDEPPILRRTKRLIERIDPDFSVVATAGDGEEALVKMLEQHIDVLFTDMRMPVMNGMQLMKKMQTLYPDCSIVVLSGYQDFEYVSSAVRAQAVDYLLKPVTEETLEKLLFSLKETVIAHKQERMQQSIALRINHMFPDHETDGLNAVRVGMCLFCSGSLLDNLEFDGYRQNPDIWRRISLADMANTLCRDAMLFVQEYMGDFASERILVYQQDDSQGNEWIEELYRQVVQQSQLPISCVSLSDTILVPSIGNIYRKLRQLLMNRIMIGKDFYESISLDTLALPEGEAYESTADSEKAMQFADVIISKNSFEITKLRSELFHLFEKES